MTKLVIDDKIPGDKSDGFAALCWVGVRGRDAADGIPGSFGLGILSHVATGEDAYADGVKYQSMSVQEVSSIHVSVCGDTGAKW
jgi:hypothetical protein